MTVPLANLCNQRRPAAGLVNVLASVFQWARWADRDALRQLLGMAANPSRGSGSISRCPSRWRNEMKSIAQAGGDQKRVLSPSFSETGCAWAGMLCVTSRRGRSFSAPPSALYGPSEWNRHGFSALLSRKRATSSASQFFPGASAPIHHDVIRRGGTLQVPDGIFTPQTTTIWRPQGCPTALAFGPCPTRFHRPTPTTPLPGKREALHFLWQVFHLIFLVYRPRAS